jgi:hypothetical protein
MESMDLIADDYGSPPGRAFVQAQMRLLAPEGREERKLGAKTAHLGVIVAQGPDREWSCDGHDKLLKMHRGSP